MFYYPELILIIAQVGINVTIADVPRKHYIGRELCERRLMELVTISSHITVPYRITSAKCIGVP